MHKGFQKCLALFLALTAAVGSVGCSEARSDAPETENAPSAAEKQELPQTAPETETTLGDDVPELDFGGDTLTFSVTTAYAYEMDAEELTGEVTNDAVFNRNKKMEDRFNVTIDETAVNNPSHTEHQAFIRQSIAAMDNSFDIAAVYVYYAGDLVLENLFTSWDSIPYVNLDNPWWVSKINKTFTVGGRLYTAVSDLCVTSMQLAYSYLFNRKIAADYDVENLYDVVDEGRWTLDCEYELTKNFYVDLNGNGKRDVKDVYGLLSDVNTSLDCYYAACGQPLLVEGEDGLDVVLKSERALTIYEKVNRIINENDGAFLIYHGQNGMSYDSKYAIFMNDSALLMPVRLSALYNQLRDMESDFGIIPYPKGDEAQEDYLTCCLDNYSVLCIPNVFTDYGMIGALAEALSCESKISVMPAFYESALQDKYSRDERSVKMLDLIMDGRTYDLSVLFTYLSGLKNFMTEGIRNQLPFASNYESRERMIQKGADKVYKMLSELGSP